MPIRNRVIIFPSFSENFYQIIKNISEYSIPLSQKNRKELYSKISYIKKYPRMYQTIKIINQKEIRKIVIKKYVILYSINDNNILNIYPQKSNYIHLAKI